MQALLQLAVERERAHPVRSYVTLPLLRLADMWLRPRVEMLNIELRWWQYSKHRAETRFAVAYGALNLAYLIAAFAGAFAWPRYRGAMLAYIALRSAVLLTVAAPESPLHAGVLPYPHGLRRPGGSLGLDVGCRGVLAGTREFGPIPAAGSFSAQPNHLPYKCVTAYKYNGYARHP